MKEKVTVRSYVTNRRDNRNNQKPKLPKMTKIKNERQKKGKHIYIYI